MKFLGSLFLLLVILLTALPLSAARVAYLDISQRREYSLDNVMDQGQVLRGHVSVKEASGPHQVVLLWRDAFGRVAGSDTVTVDAPLYSADFELTLDNSLSYYNRLESTLDGQAQQTAAEFFVRRSPKPWDDYYTAVWAEYNYEYFDSLKAAGINTHMIYKDFPYFDQVMAAGFDSYVDNICWRVFAPYHKWRHRWNTLQRKIAADPYNMGLLVREPSFEDPSTDEAIRTTVQQVVRNHAPHRPIFFNLADEIGIGDQSGPTDLDHSIHSRQAFLTWLDREYGTVTALNRQWGTDFGSFHEAARSTELLTDATMDNIWNSQLPKYFSSPGEAGSKFGITLGNFKDYVALNARLKSTPPKTVKQISRMLPGIKKQLGLEQVSAEQLAGFAAKFDQWAKSLSVDVPTDWNLSPWMEHKDFMDKSLANALGRAYGYAKDVYPNGVYGYTGGHSPGAFAGYNMEYLSRVVDLQVPYNLADDVEILRSLNKKQILLSPTWGIDETGVRRLWYQFLHGDRGIIFWDNDEQRNKFIEKETGALTDRARLFRDDINELTSGTGSLIMAAERQHDRIAVLYSHPSIRAQWMIQHLDLGKSWITRKSAQEFRSLNSNALRSSLLRLIEDHHYQYDFISYKQLEDGILDSGQYKMLLLPQTIAISNAEVTALERFVADGGALVGDNRIGLMDQKGRSRDQGALDHIFGIRWDGKEVREGLPGVTANGASNRKLGDQRVYVNRYGKGTAVYLNVSMMNYIFQRLSPGKDLALFNMFGGLFKMLGFKPPAKLTTASGSRLPATEIVRYRNGDTETWAIFRNSPTLRYAVDGSIQAGDATFDTPESVKLKLPSASHIYDVRGEKYLGRRSSIEFVLDPWRPTLLTVSPRKLDDLNVAAKSTSLSAGEEIKLNISVGNNAQPGSRPTEAVHIGVTAPDGSRMYHYEQNILLSQPSVQHIVPLAVSDAKGDWTVTVTHPASGQSRKLVFSVTQ
jgi:hypothetical protein